MPRLENKVVLLSGGASGIGAATARMIVREGGKAIVADRDEAKGHALAAELGEAAHFVPLDVVQEESWQAAVAASVEKFGALHGLLNAAGVGVRNSIEDCTLAEYRRVNDINSLGTFLGCKHAIPAMKESGGGSIVNISSVLGLRGASYAMAYCASKGAVVQLTRALAMEYVKTPLRVNAIAPGNVTTPLTAGFSFPSEGIDWDLVMRYSGLRGSAAPEEIAALVCFLASDDAKNIDGAIISSDGALTTG